MTRPASWLDRWEAAAGRRMPAAVVFLLFGELRLFEAIWQLATGRRDLRPGETASGTHAAGSSWSSCSSAAR